MYVIVVGAGAIGSQVIDLLTKTSNEIVVIETNADVADQVSRDYDCLVLNDDATKKETLIDAGSEQADAIISTTDRDPTNIMVMLLADELDIESKVSVVHDPDNMEIFRRIGVNVLENPQRLIGEYLVRAVQRPSVKDFMSLAGDAEVFEITVTETAPLAEKTLQEADNEGLLGDDVLVVAIERGDEVITPRGNTTIHAGDLITAFSKDGITSSVMQTFTGSE
ncbi:potassium channel family protein [Haloarcula argentinensis]|uniref:Potassium transporter Trk n=1 Tax=Haloarcula argentinensis TaxID=43776 RepID=A0A830FWE1_HALAR|nr:TrkA family potassium uptake protein [Haloarcula argentinensis]GGM51215.1 potassium transporter Trk [Haloarcula argentinensis]